MLTKEQKYLITILRDHLAETATTEQTGIDWSEMYRLSHAHQVSGIVCYQCRSFLPDAVQSRYLQAYAASISSFLTRTIDLEKIRNAFTSRNIEMFVVKGLVSAAYYPIPELRTMGDTDIVVHPEDRAAASRILVSMGYEQAGIQGNREWQYYKNGMEYELHDHLLYSTEEINDPPLLQMSDTCWEFVHNDTVDPGFHLIFLFLHLRKHLLNMGVGFRQFMDIAVMLKEKSLDWTWIQQQLQQMGIDQFALTCLALIQYWFNIPSPLPLLRLTSSFYEKATEAVMAGGIFGFDEKENKKNALVNRVRINGHPLREKVKNIFPSYKTMKEYQPYPYLNGRPYLLPAAYIHRIARGIHKARRDKSFIHQVLPSQSDIKKRSAYLKEWGL